MGTTFLLSVPVALAAPPENASDLRQLDALPSLSILIVEDNQINRVVVREMLESDGHRVTEAINGRSGVQKANETRFDVILMDISMPVLDGCAAAQKIKEDGGMSADSPIVCL